MAELDQPTIYNVNVTWAGVNFEEFSSLSRLCFIKFRKTRLNYSYFARAPVI